MNAGKLVPERFISLKGKRIARPSPLRIPMGRGHAVLALVLSDIVALLLSVMLSLAVKWLSRGDLDVAAYLVLWPFLFAFILIYAVVGLYSGIGISAPEELRRTTICSTLIFFFLAATTVSLRGAQRYFTWTLFLALFFAIALVPLTRECVRQTFAKASWWGIPAVIFGAGRAGQSVVRALLNQPGIGLKPVAVLDDSAGENSFVEGVPVLGDFALAPLLFHGNQSAYAVFAVPDVPSMQVMSMIERYGANFSHVLVIPELQGFSCLWVDSKSVGGMLGLELRQQVLLLDYSIVKRFLDLFITLTGGALMLPLMLLIACWIKISSAGPVFYGQTRIGQNGLPFRAWKFRSMMPHADQMLEAYLHQHPESRVEWERDHKLKNDPRVTEIGKLLRRTSLDELPQLWNVLRGEMSLVGPRPITQTEVEKYGTSFEIYKRVKGGITGLWQVSGRNDVSYAERIYWDQFYVRNWSLWLDLCILCRTIAVVVVSKGAY